MGFEKLQRILTMTVALTTEQQNASIIVLGSFNPAIFQPSWLQFHNVITDEVCEKTEIAILNSDITVLNLADTFSLKATNERFSFETNDSSIFFTLRDTVVNIFSLLEHTPIKAFGFNHQQFWKSESVIDWKLMSNRLAIMETWKNSFEEPLVRKITIEGKRKESSSNSGQITVEPVNDPDKKLVGVITNVNQHYDVPFSHDNETKEYFNSVEYLNEKLTSEWNDFLKYSDNEIARIWD